MILLFTLSLFSQLKNTIRIDILTVSEVENMKANNSIFSSYHPIVFREFENIIGFFLSSFSGDIFYFLFLGFLLLCGFEDYCFILDLKVFFFYYILNFMDP